MEVWKEIDGYNQRYEVSNFTLEYPQTEEFARYIVGKLVRLKEKANVGGNSWYCEFVHDDDRKALNMAAGWSDNKKLYLLDCVKLSDMKIKSKTGYKIALYTFVTLTVASYMWALYSIIVWIIKAFFV